MFQGSSPAFTFSRSSWFGDRARIGRSTGPLTLTPIGFFSVGNCFRDFSRRDVNEAGFPNRLASKRCRCAAAALAEAFTDAVFHGSFPKKLELELSHIPFVQGII